MIRSLVDCSESGEMTNGTFTGRAWDRVIKAVKDAVPSNQQERVTKERVRQKFDYYKSLYRLHRDMTTSNGSGWGIDEQGRLVNDNEVSEAYLKQNPLIKVLMLRPMPFKEEMSRIYGEQSATGHHAESIQSLSAKRRLEQSSGTDGQSSPRTPTPSNEVLDSRKRKTVAFNQRTERFAESIEGLRVSVDRVTEKLDAANRLMAARFTGYERAMKLIYSVENLARFPHEYLVYAALQVKDNPTATMLNSAPEPVQQRLMERWMVAGGADAEHVRLLWADSVEDNTEDDEL